MPGGLHVSLHTPTTFTTLSLVVDEVQFKYKQGSHSAPMDKEGKWMLLVGRSSLLPFSLHIANYQAIMAACQLFLWEQISSYLELIP